MTATLSVNFIIIAFKFKHKMFWPFPNPLSTYLGLAPNSDIRALNLKILCLQIRKQCDQKKSPNLVTLFLRYNVSHFRCMCNKLCSYCEMQIVTFLECSTAGVGDCSIRRALDGPDGGGAGGSFSKADALAT